MGGGGGGARGVPGVMEVVLVHTVNSTSFCIQGEVLKCHAI